MDARHGVAKEASSIVTLRLETPWRCDVHDQCRSG